MGVKWNRLDCVGNTFLNGNTTYFAIEIEDFHSYVPQEDVTVPEFEYQLV
jgi:hypothetical protein